MGITQNVFGQGSFGGMSYDVDLVLCIDGTGSMSPVIELAKQKAKAMPDDILRQAKAKGKVITGLRMRIIVFRDYLADGEAAMQVTDFYQMPDEKAEMDSLISSIVADGGGDEPEDALEALAYAMKSQWTPATASNKRRQIIAVWTDASAHRLGAGRSSKYYDSGLPKSFEELTDWWGDNENDKACMDYRSKRLALFAPEVYPWINMRNSWDNVIMYPSVAGRGLAEVDYSEIIDLLVKTI